MLMCQHFNPPNRHGDERVKDLDYKFSVTIIIKNVSALLCNIKLVRIVTYENKIK